MEVPPCPVGVKADSPMLCCELVGLRSRHNDDAAVQGLEAVDGPVFPVIVDEELVALPGKLDGAAGAAADSPQWGSLYPALPVVPVRGRGVGPHRLLIGRSVLFALLHLSGPAPALSRLDPATSRNDHRRSPRRRWRASLGVGNLVGEEDAHDSQLDFLVPSLPALRRVVSGPTHRARQIVEVILGRLKNHPLQQVLEGVGEKPEPGLFKIRLFRILGRCLCIGCGLLVYRPIARRPYGGHQVLGTVYRTRWLRAKVLAECSLHLPSPS